MKRITIVIFITIITSALFFTCKKEFLDYLPKGTVSGELLNNTEGLEGLVISAYASLGNDYWTHAFTSMWVYGGIRSDDAYKGGAGTGDVSPYDKLEQFAFITTDIGSHINSVWVAIYEGISRANEALRRMENFTESEYPQKIQRQAEMRFIRGHFHFVLKRIFKYPPFADDKTLKEDLKYISNSEYTNDELWNKIAEDFQFAVNNLPESQEQIGRPNKIAATAYLAKVRLYQAYEQDEQNNVTIINQERLQEVVDLTNNVINSQYGLFDDIAKNFLWEYENGIESIFAIQYSVDDGTDNGRLNLADGLNYSIAPGYGCCCFNAPSQNLVNAHKTNQDGIPMFDTFNDSDLMDSIDFMDNNIDPRLDHTVGIPGHPFKYDPDFICSKEWKRAIEIYGPYSPMREIQPPDCPCLKKVTPWFFGSAKNIDLLRYDDVLLMKAEALIELGRENEALPIINQIRERAKNSTERLKYANGDYISNYLIETYKEGVNCNWTLDFAREALRWERRLEFGMEGSRFFDLVRWGIAAETLNDYFEIEKIKREYLNLANFTKGRDEYLPIPEQQIDFSEGLYVQNNGW